MRKLKGCPICGEVPGIETEGSFIDIECCVSMSRQKSDVLEHMLYESGDLRRWVDIPRDKETYEFLDGWEEKIIDYAIDNFWNERA